MRDAIIIGTRPEIIKCTPIIKIYEAKGEPLLLIHTNQHYSFNMDEIFFEELHLRHPDFNLNVGSGSQADQTGAIMSRIEKLLISEKIDRILVQGDTNTVLGSALAAVKLGVKIGHVEAGLRSYDRTMPEEINRVITDHISHYLFCPTPNAAQHALDEGISKDLVFVVGNTIVDATIQNYQIAEETKLGILDQYNVAAGQYNLITAHRPANVDDPERLGELLGIIQLVIDRTSQPVIFPIHPRTRNKLAEFGMEEQVPSGATLIDPVGYLDFLVLEKNAGLIFTDSGGVQEEACILRRPCITLRDNTERPETVDVGANLITGYDRSKIEAAIDHFKDAVLDYEIPFGKGDTSEQIFEILQDQ